MATALTRGASAPRAVTPANDNARRQPGVEGRSQTTMSRNCRAESAARQPARDAAECKALATLRAQAALLGWQIERDEAGFALIRWARALHCADVQAVRAALARIGGAK